MFELKDYDYRLPQELIAQEPAKQRDASRLLVLNKTSGKISHSVFSGIHEFFNSGDILVLNNTKVIHARIFGKKQTGGKIEILLLELPQAQNKFTVQSLIKSSKPVKPQSFLYFPKNISAKVISFQDGIYTLQFQETENFEQILESIGKLPVPPYIKRSYRSKQEYDDTNSYQTVYASQKGAAAAPTAGLHFSSDLLRKIKEKNVQIVEITLHAGYGTFIPVRVSDIREHKMHSEKYIINQKSAEIINQAKSENKRIIAVGTTSVRTLEFAWNKNKNKIIPETGDCDLFIYPGYKFQIVDAIITNFHLPQSTLLMLVSGFAGHDNTLNAYSEAVKQKYRFYSYGDAMLII